MADHSRKETGKGEHSTLSETDRNAAIDRLYDVALDPARYEALLDHWETAIRPLREHADFEAPRLLDDPLIAGHFDRASAFLDRVDTSTKVDEIESILAPFDRVAAFVMDAEQSMRAVNDAARTHLGLKTGARLSDLPINPEDIEAVRRTLRSVLSDSPENTAILRVRSAQKGQFTVLRLQLCATADGQKLVLAASNEVGWPEGFRDILRQAFGLTAAEADVVRALVECGSLAEIAEQRSRSLDTIRAQVKSILSKTETHSQVELVRLALSMMDIMSLTLNAAPGPRVVSRGYGKLEEREFKSLVSADGRRHDYLVLGEPTGTPLLFLPLDYGLVRWPAPAEADAARRGIRIIVPVRPGYGLSDPVQKNDDYDRALLADIFAVLDAERVKRCPVISLGGDSYYGFQLALQHPDRISALIGCAGVLPLTRREQFERMEKWHRFILAGAKYTPHLLPFMVKAGFLLARKIGKRGFVHAVYGQCPADVETFENPDVFEAMVTGSEVALSEDHIAHAAFSMQILGRQRTDWSEDLDKLKGRLPVIFMNGLQDPQIPEATLRDFQRDHAWIDYREYDDAGQLVFFRHWRDALECVTPFLGN
ncbi:helix-turn-helix transcriptional regulator [Roseovarius faecimaris]|uniref:Helix-turn-helix transcriptional regulator n=1 Tax=Roseovarius faecimaris TaxID=2494550 RepID=A0A6I6IQ88_9RHOB|nr:alpha/beta fold hydrolase [Roseovarius faecimaris]QGX99239.1 helix-turn-helix transcriptional regulator [Roseovarius faecimaris]